MRGLALTTLALLLLAVPATAKVVRDSIGCDANGDNCTSAATDNGEAYLNVDAQVLVYDLGLGTGQTALLERVRVVAADTFGNPVDVANLTVDLLGWSSLSRALAFPSLGDVFDATDVALTNIVDPFGTTTTLGGFLTVDTLLFEFEGLDLLTGDSGEALALTGPGATFGLKVVSAINGINFVSVNGAGDLDTQLPSGILAPRSASLLSLSIQRPSPSAHGPQPFRQQQPGCPQQNGRHERMHLTLKKEATKPASFNFLQQQARRRGPKVYRYGYSGSGGGHDKSVRVTHCGRICLGRRKINLSKVFAGEIVGIREVDDQVWLVSFLDFDLGFFDRDEGRVEPGPNPFGPEKVLTMSPE